MTDPKSQNQNPKLGFRIWNYEHLQLRSVQVLRITDLQIAFVLGIASFLLYLRTLAPDVVDADGGEFQFAAWNFSFVHPTGYPLYLILGGIFQHLVPLGNPAYRLNLFTAITAALAISTFYFATKELTQHRGAAMIAAVSFALTRTFWYDASAAETYDLNAFFMALLIYLALRWQAEPTAKKFAWFCFTYALALTHHRTIALWIPIWLIFFFVVAYQSQFRFHPERIKSQLLIAVLAFLLPLFLYIYIPLRAPASPYATLAIAPGRDLTLYDNSLTGFINYFLGRVFQNEIGWDAVSVARLWSVPQLLLDQFGVIGVALGIIGFVAMAWSKSWLRLAVWLGGFVATVLFASIYHIGDIFHYYIPAYLVWAMWIGVAVAWMFGGIRNAQHVLRVPCSVLLFGVLMAQLVINFPFADRSGETNEREQWSHIFSTSIPQNAILISDNRDEMMPLWYMQYVENVRRDVVGLFPIITPAPQYANIARLTDSVIDVGRPVFFIKPMPGIEIKYRLAPAAPLVRVLGRATDTPPQFASDATLGDRVRVVGYDATRESDALHVTIYWQPQSKLDSNYTASVQLFGGRGGKIAQGNDHQIGGEFYPSSQWSVGEILRDEYSLEIPPDLSSGTYHLFVSMYRQSDMEPLGEPVEVGMITIP